MRKYWNRCCNRLSEKLDHQVFIINVSITFSGECNRAGNAVTWLVHIKVRYSGLKESCTRGRLAKGLQRVTRRRFQVFCLSKQWLIMIDTSSPHGVLTWHKTQHVKTETASVCLYLHAQNMLSMHRKYLNHQYANACMQNVHYSWGWIGVVCIFMSTEHFSFLYASIYHRL